MVLCSEAIQPMTLVRCYPIGIMKMIGPQDNYSEHQRDPKVFYNSVDRSEMHFRFNEHLGESLDIPLEHSLNHSLNHLQIFIDRSSVELFLNHGEAVFTSHVYPTKKERYYSISSDSTLKMWELRKSVKDNFII